MLTEVLKNTFLQKKLPWALLTEPKDKTPRPDLLGVEPFEATFGAKAVRKRPKLGAYDYDALAKHANTAAEGYSKDKDTNFAVGKYDYNPREQRDPLFLKVSWSE